MPRYLVVANQTLGSERLLHKIKSTMADQPCRFHLLVPASEPRWAVGEARALAGRRLGAALAALQSIGAEATGEVGDASPIRAVNDLFMIDGAFDGIILCTLPPGLSRWLRQDVVHRLTRTFPLLPCTHIVAERDRARAR
jgi:GABA permease